MKYSRSNDQPPGRGALLKERILKYVKHEVLSAVLLRIGLLVYEFALTGKCISNVYRPADQVESLYSANPEDKLCTTLQVVVTTYQSPRRNISKE